MIRRAAAGLGRLLPLLLIAAAVVIVAASALLGGCGASSGGVSAGGGTSEATATGTATPPARGSTEPAASPSAFASAAAAATTLRLYFLRGEKLGVAERRVPHTVAIGTASMKALLAGPTSSEQAAGLGTSIPAGARLLKLSIDAGTATVDLSREFGSGGGSLAMTSRVAEVVYTLTRFPTVRAVRFLMEGRPVDALGGEGLVLSRPQRRADWRDFEPNIFVETPGVGAALSNPFTLAGTAMVFEGSFQARLVDSSGRRVVQVVMQASRGAPDRGSFAREVPFSTSARAGTLIVFDRSMEDGSRQDLVRIPVTFAAE
jgi:germination protein M